MLFLLYIIYIERERERKREREFVIVPEYPISYADQVAFLG